MSNEEQNKGNLATGQIMGKPAKDTVALIKEAIEQGDVDPSYMGVALKKFAKLAELVKKDTGLQEIIESETLKHQEGTAKTFNLHGAKVTVASTGFWDYSKTADPVLQNLVDIEKDVKAFIKSRQTQLQLLAAEYAIKNKPKDIMEFGLKPFNVTWDNTPQLIWEDGAGEIATDPPTKHGKETLRYTV